VEKEKTGSYYRGEGGKEKDEAILWLSPFQKGILACADIQPLVGERKGGKGSENLRRKTHRAQTEPIGWKIDCHWGWMVNLSE